MQKVLNNANNQKVAFIEDIKDLSSLDDLASKKLCIIKTNFKHLIPLKKYIKKYPNTEFWLTSQEISREDILVANHYGIKNVLPYPFDIKIVRDYFQKNYPEKIEEKSSCDNCNWINGLKIMIVDDNLMNIDLLTETLAPFGLNISKFSNAKDALNVIDTEKFDLFLLDIMMPEISGFDLAKSIKLSKINKDTPIIFITALSDAENKIMGYNLGSCAYIEKPFNIKVVQSQVFNILKSKKLQDAMYQTKEAFVAMVAHDLKSPVNAEINALELLLKNTDDKNLENNEIITDLLHAAKYMKNLVDNILHKYKFENDNISLNKQLHSVESVIKDSLAEIKYLAKEKNQKILFKNTTDNSSTLIDYVEIKRVIHNLLSNAIDNSPKDTSIKIQLYEDCDYINVSIENISKNNIPENINDLFDKFVSIANQSKCINLGLGLYVAKKIIEAHNGKIYGKLINEAKRKIQFSFSLPKKTTEQKTQPE